MIIKMVILEMIDNDFKDINENYVDNKEYDNVCVHGYED